MRILFTVLLFISFAFFSLEAQTIKILESKPDHINLELSFVDYYPINEKVFQNKKFIYIEKDGICLRKPGEPWIPSQYYTFGMPFNKLATCKILNIIQEKIPNISVFPFPDSANQPIERLRFDPLIYTKDQPFPASPVKIASQFTMRYVKGSSLEVAPYQYNPITRELLFNKKILVQINFESDSRSKVSAILNIKDKLTEDFVASAFINPLEAKGFIGKPVTMKNSNSSPIDTSRYTQPDMHKKD
jgi:hypothetical protein